MLNRAIRKLTGEDIQVIGASRTDSGVHALGNVAVFDTNSTIPPERMSYALNQRLPEDIVVVRSEEVPEDWHPRYQDRIRKTYEYHIYNAPVPNPLRRRYASYVSFPLDVEKMQEGASCLEGEHDFVSFCNVRTQVEDTVRTVEKTGNQQRRTGDRDTDHRETAFSIIWSRIIAGDFDPGWEEVFIRRKRYRRYWKPDGGPKQE